MTTYAHVGTTPPIIFTRSEVASILNCTELTIRNREKSGKYPEPRRNPLNNYRIYSVLDIFELQYITFGQVALSPIVSKLYDKGWTNIETLNSFINESMLRFKLNLETRKEAQKAVLDTDVIE